MMRNQLREDGLIGGAKPQGLRARMSNVIGQSEPEEFDRCFHKRIPRHARRIPSLETRKLEQTAPEAAI